MPNIVITSSGNSIIADFGDYSDVLGMSKASYHKQDLSQVQLRDSHVFVYMGVTNEEWPVTYTTAAGYFTVDSVDGVAPTSESDLFDKITALR